MYMCIMELELSWDNDTCMPICTEEFGVLFLEQILSSLLLKYYLEGKILYTVYSITVYISYVVCYCGLDCYITNTGKFIFTAFVTH